MNRISKQGEYYGFQKKKVDFGSITVSEYLYDQPSTDWHYHENPYLMYIMNGQVYDINKKQTKNCSKGTLILHNWEEQHYNSLNTSSAYGFHIDFPKEWLRQHDLELKNTEGSLLIENPEIHILLAKLFKEFRMCDEHSGLGLESELINVCSKLTIDNSNKTRPDWFEDLIELLHYENDPMSLKEISDQLNVHPVHISRSFSKYVGYNLGEYRRLVKLKNSIPDLMEYSSNLTSVAHQSGFYDQSHFGRVFKKYFMISPKSFRDGLKN